MFKKKYQKMLDQLSEISREKTKGMDVGIVLPAFLKLCKEVDELWLGLMQKEKDEFQTIY